MSNREIPLRYELKYLVPEERVDDVRALIRPFCELDANSARRDDHRYVIRSIYFDTPDRLLYRASKQKHPRRFKVRARRYGSGEKVYLEVKTKPGGLVRKTRAPVPVSGLAERLAAPPDAATPAEREFHDAIGRLALEPVQLAHYEREAWFSTVDEYARVTFDRRIACQPAHDLDFDGDPAAWLPLDHPTQMDGLSRGVVLELKCTRDVPVWMAHLVESLEARRTGFSKYCSGIERLEGLERDIDPFLQVPSLH